jgi:hypothetical protein
VIAQANKKDFYVTLRQQIEDAVLRAEYLQYLKLFRFEMAGQKQLEDTFNELTLRAKRDYISERKNIGII